MEVEQRIPCGTLRRLALSITLFLCTYLGLATEARADCGLHELTTVFAPKARAVEAMPLSIKTLTRPEIPTGYDYLDYDRLDAAGRAFAGGVHTCPDDPAETRDLPYNLSDTWFNAIRLQNIVGDYNLIRTGAVKEPAVCRPYDFALIRSVAAAAVVAGPFGHPAIFSQPFGIAMSQLPGFSHVRTLWETSLTNIGLALPTASQTPTDIAEWAHSFSTVSANAYAHLPDGVRCAGLPSTI